MNTALTVFEAELAREAAAAGDAVFHSLAVTAPWLTAGLETWFRKRGPDGELSSYFVHADVYPVVYLPRWYATSIGYDADHEIFGVATRASVAGCLWIRLVDDVMDEAAVEPRKLLPAVAPVHEEAIGPYRAYFSAAPEIVSEITRIWCRSAEHTYADAQLDAVEDATFRRVVSAKFSATQMPLVATAAALGDQTALTRWFQLLDAFSAWHQMLNDTVDWSSDLSHGVSTYVLTEARNAAGADRNAITRWMLERGFHWAADHIDTLWREVLFAAQSLDVPVLGAFLERRGARAAAQVNSLLQASKALLSIASSQHATCRTY